MRIATILMYIATVIMLVLLYILTKNHPALMLKGESSSKYPIELSTQQNGNPSTTSTKANKENVENSPVKTMSNISSGMNRMYRRKIIVHKSITRVVVSILVLYTVTYMPFMIFAFIRDEIEVPNMVSHVLTLLMSVNFFGNSIIYTFLSKELRSLYGKILCFGKCFKK